MVTNNNNEFLVTQSALLQPLGKTAILDHIQHGRFRLVKFTQGTTIHFEGEVCRKVEIILSGEVLIERTDSSGNLMTVAHCFRDDLLGGNLLFSKHPHYPMTLLAAQDTLLLTIDKNLLFELLSQCPPFLQIYLELSSDRASVLGNQIRQYLNQSIRISLIHFIQQEHGRQKCNPIRLNISKKMLAEKLGVQRTSVSRELAKMRQESLIIYDKNSLTVLDTAAILLLEPSEKR